MLRFCLVHDYLSGMLPHFRALKSLQDTAPLRVKKLVLPAQAPAWWHTLPACLGLSLEVEQSSLPSGMGRPMARIFKGLVGELRLTYNKARQSQITQEVAEIAAGANAQR